jgi:hypothetical protein
VTPKYIEELVPTDNFGKVIEAVKQVGTPEYRFISKLTQSIIAVNVLAILLIIISLLIFIRKIIYPIKIASDNIKKLDM